MHTLDSRTRIREHHPRTVGHGEVELRFYIKYFRRVARTPRRDARSLVLAQRLNRIDIHGREVACDQENRAHQRLHYIIAELFAPQSSATATDRRFLPNEAWRKCRHDMLWRPASIEMRRCRDGRASRYRPMFMTAGGVGCCWTARWAAFGSTSSRTEASCPSTPVRWRPSTFRHRRFQKTILSPPSS